MKGLIKRNCYYFFRPHILFVFLVAIIVLYFAGVFLPQQIYNNYTPKIEHSFIFGDQDSAKDRTLLMLLGITILLYCIITAAAIMFARTIIKRDAISHWNMYLAATPVKRSTYIIEKYVLIFLATVILSLFYSVSDSAFLTLKTGFNISRCISSVMLKQCLEILLISVMIPLLFVFGSKKGGIVFLISCGVILESWSLLFPAIYIYSYFTPTQHLVFAICIFVFSLAMFILSCRVSIKIYKKRHF